ncbi:MAG: hypothetical protein GY943_07275 [Chloroflexi bacterium]|nr:hypothetical protein [Chloroflexota bacterium]
MIIDWLSTHVPVVVSDYGRYRATAVSFSPLAIIIAFPNSKRNNCDERIKIFL